MKNNLFLIHTPMQLFVAQQIIHQEGLDNNILLYGYVPGNKHFVDIYNLMIIPSMWKERIPRSIDVGWALVDFTNFFSSIRSVKKNFRVIESFMQNKDVGALYLGDISNRGHQLLAKIFYGKIRIVFFEEGSSHYMKPLSIPPQPILQRIRRAVHIALLDTFLFKPMCGFTYTKEFYYEFINRDKIPMDERYSIIPYYHKSYDKRLITQRVMSSDLEKYLLSEIGSFMDIKGQDLFLFLSSPIYEITSTNEIPLVVEVVNDFAKTISGSSLLIKFHPRETEIVKNMMLEKFTSNNVKFKVISSTINIPVEYYLQMVHFSKIFAFASSSLLYNGYLYKETPIVRLDKFFLEKCREKSISRLQNIEKYCDNFDSMLMSNSIDGKDNK